MKLKSFKEKNDKKTGIILFSVGCVLLVTGAFLYKSFALFTTHEEKNIIKGNVEEMNDIYFAFYVNDTLQKEMPTKESGLVLDEEKSYCGLGGKKDSQIKVSLNENYSVIVSGIQTARTKCNLYFVQGKFINGKGVPLVTEGNGLYEILHEAVTGTTNDEGFQQTEYRYAGSNPDNYVLFHNEIWRIIGLVNVKTADGNIEQRLKIRTNQPLGTFAWNENGTSDWANSTLKDYFNNNYLNQFDEKEKKMIETNIIWSLGVIDNNGDLPIDVDGFYQTEREKKQNEFGFQNEWNGPIALIYPSDYIYATAINKNVDCYKRENYMNQLCYGANWTSLLNDSAGKGHEWGLNPLSYEHRNTIPVSIASNGQIAYGRLANDSSYYVYPTLYLSQFVKIKDGTGKDSNPFQLQYVLE